MKKQYIVIMAMIACVFLFSCNNGIDDIFDKPSTERVNEALEKYHNILTAPTHGWLLQYFAGTEKERNGGYNMLLKFTDTEVTATGELMPKTKATSLYKLQNMSGPTLSFETYNTVIHYFSDPSLSPPLGFDGDYEFTILEASSEVIVLQGTKKKQFAVLTPLREPMDSYIARLSDFITNVSKYSQYDIYFGEQKVGSGSVDNNRAYSFDYTDGDKSFTVKENAIFTTSGIEFYKPVTLMSTEVESFTFDASRTMYVSDNNPKITLHAHVSDTYMSYEELIGTYKLYYKIYTNDDKFSYRTVELVENIYNDSFILKGAFGYDYDIKVRYNVSTGHIEIIQQLLDMLDENTALNLGVWNLSKGFYYHSYSGYGMYFVKDPSTPEVRLNNVDNGSGYAEAFVLVSKAIDGSDTHFYGEAAKGRLFYPYLIKQ